MTSAAPKSSRSHQPRPNEPQTAHWIDPYGEAESIEITATPEARAYFEQVMSRDEC